MHTNKPILIVDDEPYAFDWLEEFLEKRGYSVVFSKNVDDALLKIESLEYRFIIVDMNIPASESLLLKWREKSSEYGKYPGLIVASQARTNGYRDRQVVIFTVFSNSDIQNFALKLDCTYMLKGRPTLFKREIDRILSYDPSIK